MGLRCRLAMEGFAGCNARTSFPALASMRGAIRRAHWRCLSVFAGNISVAARQRHDRSVLARAPWP